MATLTILRPLAPYWRRLRTRSIWVQATHPAPTPSTQHPARERWFELPVVELSWLPVGLKCSVRPLGTLDRRSPHQPTLRRREILARMGRAAVVPEEEVADAPNVLVDKLPLLGVVEHGVEQRVALFLRHVDDADRHQPVDVDRLAVGVLIGAEHRVDALAEGFGAFAIALLGRAIVVVMDGLAAAELVARRGIERVVGGIAAREQRIAAGVGNFDRVKQGRLVGHLGVDHVVVEHHLAVRQRSDRLAVLADVRNEHDPGQEPRIALWEESCRSTRHAHLAEIAGDADEVFLLELLIRENDHEVIEPGLIDRLDGVVVGLVAQVQPADFRPDMLGERNNIESGHRDHSSAFHSTLIAPLAMTLRLRSSSARSSRANSCGLEAMTSKSFASSDRRAAGARGARMKASWSLRAASSGIPAPAAKPIQIR